MTIHHYIIIFGKYRSITDFYSEHQILIYIILITLLKFVFTGMVPNRFRWGIDDVYSGLLRHVCSGHDTSMEELQSLSTDLSDTMLSMFKHSSLPHLPPSSQESTDMVFDMAPTLMCHVHTCNWYGKLPNRSSIFCQNPLKSSRWI